MPYTHAFWQAIDRLVADSSIVIDRKKGSAHPRYPNFLYPLDYGYLENTASMDGGGIDLWRGSLTEPVAQALILTVDLLKRDSEIKLLLGCTEEEILLALEQHNNSEYMKGILVRRNS